MPDDLIARFAAVSNDAALFLDFDGTLSEIVPVPSEARPMDGVTELLHELRQRFRAVAVVSGRSARELVDWLGRDIEIWGLHGAQRATNGVIEVSEWALAHVDVIATVKEELGKRLHELDLEGVILEDKEVMLTLHFRTARDPKRAERVLDELSNEVASSHGLVRAEGRSSFELRPPVEFTKGAVVTKRSRDLELRAVAFVGDDKVDLPGFDALDSLERRGVTTLRVAVKSEQAPPELLARADVVVDGPAGVLSFLRRLVR